MGFEDIIQLSPAVKAALESNKPIVALESTIITHGMEYPQNYNTASSLEKIISEQNVTPATIAILAGKIHVGLTEEELLMLSKQKNVFKCSRRDLSKVIALQQYGSTTVAATMMICSLVGIRVFVTGGIGGVHRYGESTMDISADLRELGQTRVAVVCAGAKSILDIKRTLEYLETEGVPVLGIFQLVGYKTEKFPAFFTDDSGFKCSGSVQNAQEAAKIIKVQEDLKINTGILYAVPIPKEHQANGAIIQEAIERAIQESIEQQIEGAESTPFLLKRVNELTDGQSSQSNVALIQNNALVGAQIASELYKLLL